MSMDWCEPAAGAGNLVTDCFPHSWWMK